MTETTEASIVGSTEAPSKVFLLFFLFSDWLKSNHLRSWIERGFFGIFSASEWQTTQQVLARKNVQKTKFEAAEMILDPWNQQVDSKADIYN